MYLVTVSGSADQLSALRDRARIVAPKTTGEPDGQWLVVGYVDGATLDELHRTDLPIVVLQDEARVESHFATVRSQIGEGQAQRMDTPTGDSVAAVLLEPLIAARGRLDTFATQALSSDTALADQLGAPAERVATHRHAIVATIDSFAAAVEEAIAQPRTAAVRMALDRLSQVADALDAAEHRQ
jgi:hypothetical protein